MLRSFETEPEFNTKFLNTHVFGDKNGFFWLNSIFFKDIVGNLTILSLVLNFLGICVPFLQYIRKTLWQLGIEAHKLFRHRMLKSQGFCM